VSDRRIDCSTQTDRYRYGLALRAFPEPDQNRLCQSRWRRFSSSLSSTSFTWKASGRYSAIVPQKTTVEGCIRENPFLQRFRDAELCRQQALRAHHDERLRKLRFCKLTTQKHGNQLTVSRRCRPCIIVSSETFLDKTFQARRNYVLVPAFIAIAQAAFTRPLMAPKAPFVFGLRLMKLVGPMTWARHGKSPNCGFPDRQCLRGRGRKAIFKTENGLSSDGC